MTVTTAGVCAARCSVLVDDDTDCSSCDSRAKISSSEAFSASCAPDTAVQKSNNAALDPITTPAAIAPRLHLTLLFSASQSALIPSHDFRELPRERLHVGGGG